VAGSVPPRNLFKGTCATCRCGQCLEISPDEFGALIAAVKNKFGTLPVDEEAAVFVAGWVADNGPKDATAGFKTAFMSRYFDFARDVLCGNLEI